MSGCLTLPLRLLLLALLAGAVFLLWTYRREVRRQLHEWTADPTEATATGTGSVSGSGPVEERLARLARAPADSVVLTATETASLLAGLAGMRVPGALDSITVRLGDDDVEVSSTVEPARLGLTRESLRGLLRDRERVHAGGRLVFRRIGRAEWLVDRVRVRGIPIPAAVAELLLRRSAGLVAGSAVPIPLPESVGGLRVTPAGLVFYGIGVR